MKLNIFSKNKDKNPNQQEIAQTSPEQTTPDLLNMDITTLVDMVKGNPELIREFIAQVDESLKEHRANVEAIKGRGFFKKIVSSNTSDLAKALMDESNILSSFFSFLQLLTFICQGNAVISYQILHSLNTNAESGESGSKHLYEMARTYISDAIETSNNEKIRENAIKRLLINVTSLNRWHRDDEIYKEKISERISFIENNISEIRTDEISRLDEHIAKINVEIDSIKKNIDILKKKTWLDNPIVKLTSLLLAALGFILSLIAIILLR